MENYKIKIAHLYPKVLNLFGDNGNIVTLIKRCLWRNIEVEFDEINSGDELSEHDLYFIGSGLDKQQKEIADLMLKSKDFFIKERDNNKVFLGIDGGFQLLGNYYQNTNGERTECVSLIDSYTIESEKRFTGNVTLQTDFAGTIIGFENHNKSTFLQGETKPLGTVKIGNGNNGKDNFEGARFKNVFATYLHGPVLPKNPEFADCLIKLALENRYGKSVDLKILDDTFEQKNHEALIGKSY